MINVAPVTAVPTSPTNSLATPSDTISFIHFSEMILRVHIHLTNNFHTFGRKDSLTHKQAILIPTQLEGVLGGVLLALVVSSATYFLCTRKRCSFSSVKGHRNRMPSSRVLSFKIKMVNSIPFLQSYIIYKSGNFTDLWIPQHTIICKISKCTQHLFSNLSCNIVASKLKHSLGCITTFLTNLSRSKSEVGMPLKSLTILWK